MADVATYTQPDVEAWVWSVISSIGSVHSEQVDTAAAGEPQGWLMRHVIQVDARSSTKENARAKINQALQAILGNQNTNRADGVWGAVQVETGPVWQPEPSGQPRYLLRVAIYAHPLSGP